LLQRSFEHTLCGELRCGWYLNRIDFKYDIDLCLFVKCDDMENVVRICLYLNKKINYKYPFCGLFLAMYKSVVIFMVQMLQQTIDINCHWTSQAHGSVAIG
jgi:hypothetical protein